jgi:hypothetical protein
MNISYADALDGVLGKDDIDGVVGLIEQTKNWGNIRGRVPSYLIVALVDEIKKLKEQQLNFYKTHGIKTGE